MTENVSRSAKAGRDCNAVPKEESRCPESAACCCPSGRVKSAMQGQGAGASSNKEADMAKGINLPFVVAAEKAKEFLQKDPTAFERLMDKARSNIPEFDNKRVKR